MPNKPHIVVVGSANIDLTTFIDAMPRAGETIFGREFHLGFGGKGANQAVAAQMCGARVSVALDRVKALRSEGLGYDRIAARLNEEKIPTRTGKPWHGVVVNRILIGKRQHIDA